MEVLANSYMPGDPRLVQQLVCELKSQGIFDQFRKECISDVDTKPAYQNLRQRVEGTVASFLKQQTWCPDMNKNQVREQLRKNIYESGYLEAGVERIVDQVVNPKINTVFLPQVEEVVYKYLGIQKPVRESKKGGKVDITDLLPNDLEAVSPESVDNEKDDDTNKMDESLHLNNSSLKTDEDESPPFEPLDSQTSIAINEENSVDSHLSGISGLQSHDSNHGSDTKMNQMEFLNQDSQTSQNSSDGHLSIITSDDTKMDICDDSESKIMKSSDSETKMDTIDSLGNRINENNKSSERKSLNKSYDDKKLEKKYEEKRSGRKDEKKNDDRSNDKKSRSSDKYSQSKERKDDKHKKTSSSSSSKDRQRSLSRHNSSSSSKDTSVIIKDKEASSHSKDKDLSVTSKDKHKISKSSSSSKDREKGDRDKNRDDRQRTEKDKEKIKSDKDKQTSIKEKNKDKNRAKSDKETYSRDKDKSKEKSYKDQSDRERKKERSDKDKNERAELTKTRKRNRSSSSSSNKVASSNDTISKDNEISSNPKKDKESSKFESLNSSKETKERSKSGNVDSKHKHSSDKHKKDEKYASSSSNKNKEKDKKKDSKKSKDDHYSSKDKKNNRRSTDRDSNDGQSSKPVYSNLFSESNSSSSQKSNQDSNSTSGSGSNDSGNSDHTEENVLDNNKPVDNNSLHLYHEVKVKYIKPKFALNLQEALKIMRIRKQLAKLERENQLSLTQIDLQIPIENGIEDSEGSEDNEEHVDIKTDAVIEDKQNVSDLSLQKDITEENCSLDNKDSILTNTFEEETVVAAQDSTEINNLQEEDNLVVELDKSNTREIMIDLSRHSVSVENKEKINKKISLQTTNLSKENWEALEARLAQEMSNVNYNSYEPYDDYDYSGIEVVTSPKKNINHVTRNGKMLEANDKIDKSQIKCNKENWQADSNKKHVAFYETDYPDDTNLEISREENPTDTNKLVIQQTRKDFDLDENKTIKEDFCRYLEKPSPSLKQNLEYIFRFIAKLQKDVDHCREASKNNFMPKKRGRKRKVNESIDFKNNNKTNFEQTVDLKKRLRYQASNSNTTPILKANKMINCTDVAPDENYPLPLSPAESDLSVDRREEEIVKPAKQKRNTSKASSKRYSSEDLYKPRLLIGSSRRSRSAKNIE